MSLNNEKLLMMLNHEPNSESSLNGLFYIYEVLINYK